MAAASKDLDYLKINTIIQELRLTENGVYDDSVRRYTTDNSHNSPYLFNKENLERFLEAIELIPILFESNHVRSGCGSYGLKHYLEKFMKTNYIDNATTILAFKYLDYPVKKYSYPTPNVSVKVKKLFPDALHTGLSAYIQNLKRKQIVLDSVIPAAAPVVFVPPAHTEEEAPPVSTRSKSPGPVRFAPSAAGGGSRSHSPYPARSQSPRKPVSSIGGAHTYGPPISDSDSSSSGSDEEEDSDGSSEP